MSNSKKPDAHLPPHRPSAVLRAPAEPGLAQDPFTSIDPAQLENVAGGSARVTARSGAANDQIMTLLSSIGDSIKALASNQSSGSDPMQVMMMMMMMGGMGGGGGAAPAPAPQPAPPAPTINISTNVRRC
jgi:hypothetical protein